VTQIPSLREALWHNNPALVQLLGLCPLLAVSQYAVTAITLGLISLVVMTLSNLIISLLRPLMFELIRLPLQIMVIASLVTAADLLLQAFYFELHQRIGLFVALIVTNCAILGRAELFARRSSAPKALIDGWFMGLGFFWVIAVMGMAREILGKGTIFAEAGRLTGLDIPNAGIQITSFSIQLVSFAPGAFFIFALMIAAKNYLDLRHEQRQENSVSQPTEG
jgi:electron transport complex protein RnfE